MPNAMLKVIRTMSSSPAREPNEGATELQQQQQHIQRQQQEQQHDPHRAAARRGLLKIMLDRFSSTPLQEEEYSTSETMRLRDKLAEKDQRGMIDDFLQYDATLTQSERNYLDHILQNGDTDSIQSASAKLQDESLFPQQKHL